MKLNWFGLVGGYIVGMTLQAVMLPFFMKGFIDSIWLLVQLIGLFIMTGIWIYLDRKVIIPWVKNIEWKSIENTIDNWFLKIKKWLTK